MKQIAIISLIIFCIVGFIGCSTAGGAAEAAQATEEPAATQELAEPAQAEGTVTTGNTTDANATTIEFDGADAAVAGEGAQADGAQVTITGGGTYAISGRTTDGSVTVNTPGEDVTLVLNGADITSTAGPAVLIQDAASATVTLADGTENALADGGESEYDGALYGAVSYTINGGGTLDVSGNVEEGIASEMHLTIDGGVINITAPDDGINANNDGVSEIIFNGGTVSIVAGGDGIDSNGAITINGGTIVTSGSIDDMSGGLDADGDIVINGGTVFATGAANAAIAQSAQGYIAYQLDGTQAAGGTVAIQQGDTELFSATVATEYQTVFYSDASLEEGADYDLYIDGKTAATANVEDSVSATGMMPGGPGQMPQDGEFPAEGMTPPEGMEEPPEGMQEGDMPRGERGAPPDGMPSAAPTATQSAA